MKLKNEVTFSQPTVSPHALVCEPQPPQSHTYSPFVQFLSPIDVVWLKQTLHRPYGP